MNKKLIISLSVIGAVAAIAVGGTIAYFSDTETSTGNSFAAGTLNLALTDASENGTESETNTWVFSNIKPTDSDSATLVLNNTGTLAGYVDISNISITDDEGTNPESETSTGKKLSDLLYVWMFWDVNHNGNFDSGDGDVDIYGTSASYAKFSAMATSYDIDEELVASNTAGITMKYNWPSSADDNDAQGDTTTMTFTVELDQQAD
jgi:spore coat-associated protein N